MSLRIARAVVKRFAQEEPPEYGWRKTPPPGPKAKPEVNVGAFAEHARELGLRIQHQQNEFSPEFALGPGSAGFEFDYYFRTMRGGKDVELHYRLGMQSRDRGRWYQLTMSLERFLSLTQEAVQQITQTNVRIQELEAQRDAVITQLKQSLARVVK